MANHNSLASLFSDTANAIREKTGETGAIVADNFPAAIRAISSGQSVTDVIANADTVKVTGSYASTGFFNSLTPIIGLASGGEVFICLQGKRPFAINLRSGTVPSGVTVHATSRSAEPSNVGYNNALIRGISGKYNITLDAFSNWDDDEYDEHYVDVKVNLTAV